MLQNISSNKVFIESLNFKNLVTKDLQLIDLNKVQGAKEDDEI